VAPVQPAIVVWAPQVDAQPLVHVWAENNIEVLMAHESTVVQVAATFVELHCWVGEQKARLEQLFAASEQFASWYL